MNDSSIEIDTDERGIFIRRPDGLRSFLCSIDQADDGFWYAADVKFYGLTDAWVMRAIANRLDDANRQWRSIVDGMDIIHY